MNKKIENFIYPTNSDLDLEENLRIYNRSSNDNLILQSIFQQSDKLAKRIIKDLYNTNQEQLFKDNSFSILTEEDTIKKVIENKLEKIRGKGGELINPEMIYRGFKFNKPSNLLPEYNTRIELIKQLGRTSDGEVKLYLINPYFLAYKLSFDLFNITIFNSELIEGLQDGFRELLGSKYGESFIHIFDYVGYTSYKAINEGIEKGDENDETLIEKNQEISGIIDNKLFYEFIYRTSMFPANGLREELIKQQSK